MIIKPKKKTTETEKQKKKEKKIILNILNESNHNTLKILTI